MYQKIQESESRIRTPKDLSERLKGKNIRIYNVINFGENILEYGMSLTR